MIVRDVTPPRPTGRPPERIEHLWLFVTIDPRDGSEGIIAEMVGGMMMPFLAADEARLTQLRARAQQIADTTHRSVEVRKFSAFEVVERIGGEA